MNFNVTEIPTLSVETSTERKKRIIAEHRNQPCMDCHQQFPPICMDFDHRDPMDKVDSISDYKQISVERLILEIAKCDIVCANCHRIRTEKQRLLGLHEGIANRRLKRIEDHQNILDKRWKLQNEIKQNKREECEIKKLERRQQKKDQKELDRLEKNLERCKAKVNSFKLK